MTYNKKEFNYLLQYYSESQIDNYCKGSNKKLNKLYNLTQPKDVNIYSLKDVVTKNQLYLVDSPDGWVPVNDWIEKPPKKIYRIEFNNNTYINASYDHLFQKISEEWVYTENLKIGDKLISDTGYNNVINIIEKLDKEKVYDLSINHDNHRYYTNGICSHNSGKSLFLQNLALNWALMGLNVVYITFELSEELTSMRLDAMVTNTPTRQIFSKIDEVDLKVRMVGKNSGELDLIYLPAQSNTNDIRSFIKEWEIQNDKRADAVCVDYLDLVMPVSVRVDPSNLFVKDKYVTEELRNLAIEYDILFATASQLNRNSVEEIEFDHSHIAGGISKINTADNVIGIFSSRALKEKNRVQIQLMKTRSSNGVGQKIDLGLDADSMRIIDLGIEGEDIVTPVTAITEKLKTKSVVMPGTAVEGYKPPDQEHLAAPKVQADGARLREMLRNVNDEL